MPDWTKPAPIIGLAAATIAPLVLTLGTNDPIALTIGCGLTLALVEMTFTKGKGPHDEKAEAAAISHVVMTSSANRAARLLLGSTFLYASATFGLRMTAAGADGVQLLTRLALLEPRAIGTLALTWIGCSADCLFAGVWLSTGRDGQ